MAEEKRNQDRAEMLRACAPALMNEKFNLDSIVPSPYLSKSEENYRKIQNVV